MTDKKQLERWLVRKAIQRIDNIIISDWLVKARRWSKKWHKAEE